METTIQTVRIQSQGATREAGRTRQGYRKADLVCQELPEEVEERGEGLRGDAKGGRQRLEEVRGVQERRPADAKS